MASCVKVFVFLCFVLSSISNVAAQRLLFVGDSLTAGYGVEQEQSFPSLIEVELKKKHPKVKVSNAGVSGSLSSSGLSRLKWHLKGQKPDILILALGANDALKATDVEVVEANLAQTIEFALSKKIKVILTGMKVFKNYGSDYGKAFESVYTNLKKRYPNIIFYPFLLEGVALNKKLILPDGLHPTSEGHKVISKNLLPVIEGAL